MIRFVQVSLLVFVMGLLVYGCSHKLEGFGKSHKCHPESTHPYCED